MHPLLTLLAQVVVILLVARTVGRLFRLIHQPQVVGEMVAGIMLGPTLLGWLVPGLSAALFPPESLELLERLSQVGLLLFMLLVGLEFDPRLLRGREHTAFITSHVSIVFPFLLGTVLALYLYPRLSDAGVSFTGFALFLGAAMSVTAFPVLARILSERNLLRTRVGAVTIACAAVDDVTAWSILALVITIVRARGGDALLVMLAGSLAYIGLMVTVVRRGLRVLEGYYRNRGRFTQDLIGVVLLVTLASSWTTEWLGIHALFGAFVAGTVMPKDRRFVTDLTDRLEDVTVVLLLPLFFASTGLRTSFGLVTGGAAWGFFGLVMLVAVVGKFGGSAAAARVTGLSWRESGALGILMNTRGLMELVILTIGLDLGVISPLLFSMMVFMAIITTFMTTPVLALLYPMRLIRRETLEAEPADTAWRVLIPVSLPRAGPGLLRVARALAPADRGLHVYALHLERGEEQGLTEARPDPARRGDEALEPLLAQAKLSGVDVRQLAFVSRDVAADIADVARAKAANIVLLGWHKPVVSRTILGGTVNDVLREAPADVAVYVERGFDEWKRILVPHRGGPHDDLAVELAERIAASANAELTVLHVAPADAPEPSALGAEQRIAGGRVSHRIARHDVPLQAVLSEARSAYDLIVIGVARAWGLHPSPFGTRHEQLARKARASLLIVRKHLPKVS
jgi:Kef-type K+ transport system membrane component KefB